MGSIGRQRGEGERKEGKREGERVKRRERERRKQKRGRGEKSGRERESKSMLGNFIRGKISDTITGQSVLINTHSTNPAYDLKVI